MERLRIESQDVKPVPTKLLIPLLEASSLEDPDDEEMHDLWANLLASASSKANVQPRFAGILKELQGRQAKLLEKIARNNAPESDQRWRQLLANSPTDFDSYQLTDKLAEIQRLPIFHTQSEGIFDSLFDWLNTPGCAAIDVIIASPEVDGEMLSIPATAAFGAVDDMLDLGILSSLGLLQKCSGVTTIPRGPRVVVLYYCFTDLGVSFYSACHNLGLNE